VATYVVSLGAGVGNIVESMPFLWFLKGRGETVIGRREFSAFSSEACELASVACDAMIEGKWHIIGAIDKGLPIKGPPCKAHDRSEWEAWFTMHGFVPPKVEDVRTDTAWEDVDGRYDVVLAPTSKSNWLMKKWPYWGKLAEMIPGCAVVGLPGDGGEFGSGCVDLRGKMTLKQLAGLFRKARCVVAQEGGLAHLSAAHGTRTFILYGGTSWLKNFPPRNGVLVLPEKLMPCQPCQFKSCHVSWDGGVQTWHGCNPGMKADGKWSRCMAALTPERVMEVAGWAR